MNGGFWTAGSMNVIAQAEAHRRARQRAARDRVPDLPERAVSVSPGLP